MSDRPRIPLGSDITEGQLVGAAQMIRLLRELERDIRAGNVSTLALTATRKDRSLFERFALADGAVHELVGAMSKHIQDLNALDVRPEERRTRSEPIEPMPEPPDGVQLVPVTRPGLLGWLRGGDDG
jgi:hypothetical protein